MSDSKKTLTKSAGRDIDAFLKNVASTPRIKAGNERGRLIFAMDATASREPTWDTACQLQAEMFSETASLGGLSIQLCYYRGFAEFHASDWTSQSSQLLQQMTAVTCLGGHTQIEKILIHALKETKVKKVDALVFVGDCLEEGVDDLCRYAGKLGLLGVPMFIFHEGYDPVAEKGFRQMASLSGGAYCAFDSGSAQQLKDLLNAVAVYAAGGRHALENFNKRKGKVVLQLQHKK